LECVVCATVEQRVPRWVVYEDTQVIAFLPREMEVSGHTVVAPRVHYPDLEHAPAELLARLMEVVQKLAGSYRERIGAQGFDLRTAAGIAAPDTLPHLHFHLLPRFAENGPDPRPTHPGERFDRDATLGRLGFPVKQETGWGS
jgi:histidine triad (HIT) family protein